MQHESIDQCGVKERKLARKSGENYGRKKIRNFIDKEVK